MLSLAEYHVGLWPASFLKSFDFQRSCQFLLQLAFTLLLAVFLCACEGPSHSGPGKAEGDNFKRDVRILTSDRRTSEIQSYAKYVEQCERSPSGSPRLICDPVTVACQKASVESFEQTPGDTSQKDSAAQFAFIQCQYSFMKACTAVKINAYNKTNGTIEQKTKAKQLAYNKCVQQITGK